MKYKNRLRKPILVFAILLVSAVAFEAVVKNVIANDPDVELAEEFLRSSSQVKEKYGKIDNIGVAKLTSVSATPTASPYKIISFYISGEESGAEEVIVYLTDEGSVDDTKSIRFR